MQLTSADSPVCLLMEAGTERTLEPLSLAASECLKLSRKEFKGAALRFYLSVSRSD